MTDSNGSHEVHGSPHIYRGRIPHLKGQRMLYAQLAVPRQTEKLLQLLQVDSDLVASTLAFANNLHD